MKNLKYGILGFGILGIISVFLPFESSRGESISLWKMYSLLSGMGAEWPLLKLHPYTHIVMSLVGAAMAGISLTKPMARWQGIVATVAFVIAALNMRGGFFKLEALTDLAIGGKIMWIAVAGGLVLSILTIVKPEKSA